MTVPLGSETSVPVQSQLATQRDTYLKMLLAQGVTQGSDELALDALRETAKALVKEQTLPSTREENWRFTDLSPLLEINFQGATAAPQLTPEALASLALPTTLAETRLVFVNGVFAADLSTVAELPPGVMLSTLAQLYPQADWQSKLAPKLAQAPGGHEVFTALNTASFGDAAVLWIPRHTVIDRPIHLVHVALAEATPTVAHPRCLVVAEAHSAVTLIEEFRGLGTADYWTNGVTEIWLDDGAKVNHTRLQQEQHSTFHIGKTAVSQDRNSHYTCNAIALGAALSRHHLEVYQTGPNTETQLYGLSAIADRQHSDVHSVISFAHPHGSAEQLQKCIVDGQARSVFNGKIFVPREAQLTNASQLNRNLLLSDRARVYTKPQLEIIADNVKCAHGATVSQLEADEIFYLQSRGISATEAQRLLLYGFVMEIVEKIPVSAVRDALTTQVTRWAS